jgi:hypothetical protein
MAITVKHSKVSAIPDGDDTSVVRPSDWNADHTLSGTVPVANGGTGASTLTGYVKGNGTSAMTASATVPSTDVTGLGTMSTQNANSVAITGGSITGTTVAGYIPTTEKAAALGVATLDAGGTIPLSQIPASIQGGVSYQGTWNASTNTPTLTNGVGTKGYYYVVSVAGSTNLDGITSWNVGDWAIFNGTVWQKVDNTDAVTSVNGYTGTVVLTAADVSAIPYTGATGAVDLNNKSLTNVSNLGVGTSTVPTIKIRAVGDNNSSSRIAMRGYSSDANSSAIRVTKFRGTFAAPQAPQSGDSLGKFELAGYGTTSSEGYPQASYEGLATEAWGATARGTKAVFKVTPNTTITQVTALTIDQNSAATFGSSVTATSFSGSGSGLTSIPNSALTNSAITINGTSTSLGGSVSVGTVTSVTGTSPVVSSGGNTPAISMPAATTSVNGYLTSTDWNTFNGKGSGSVTSVAATVPSFLSVTGSPITTSGTLAISYSGTALPILNGGTGQTTASAAFNALSPLTTAGDVLYGGTSGAGTRLAIGTAGQVLTVNAGATAPQWSTPTTGTVTTVSVASANGFAGTVANATTTPAITLTTSITGLLKGNATAISAATSGTDYSAGTSALGTGILKSTTTTGALTIAVAADFPTLNQNTTGSAATLTTPRAIYGNNFDGSAALTQIIASTYGGTGNGFTKFSGATTAERTYTLPDSNATLLYSGGPLGTPSSGTVTNFTGTASININGTVGATTASTGAFTTVSATGVITSTLATGTAPFTVASTTQVANLNAATAGTAGNVTGTVAVANGGTGLTTLTAGYIPYGAGTSAFASSSSLFWDSANTRLGLGTSTVNQKLELRGDSTSVSQLVLLNNKGASNTTAYYVGGVWGAGYRDVRDPAYIAGIDFYRSSAVGGLASSGDIRFYTDGNGDTLTSVRTNGERMRIFASGGVSIGTTTDAGASNLYVNKVIGVGATPATSGAGITFPATQSASTDANTLDDYEEGTFTPTISGTTTAGTGTYTAQFGVYTKVGSVVTVQVNLGISNHTGTGNILLSGLPFTSFATTDYWGVISIGYVNNLALTALNFPTGIINVNTTYASLYQSPTGGGAATAVPMDTSFGIIYTATYRTT